MKYIVFSLLIVLSCMFVSASHLTIPFFLDTNTPEVIKIEDALCEEGFIYGIFVSDLENERFNCTGDTAKLEIISEEPGDFNYFTTGSNSSFTEYRATNTTNDSFLIQDDRHIGYKFNQTAESDSFYDYLSCVRLNLTETLTFEAYSGIGNDTNFTLEFISEISASAGEQLLCFEQVIDPNTTYANKTNITKYTTITCPDCYYQNPSNNLGYEVLGIEGQSSGIFQLDNLSSDIQDFNFTPEIFVRVTSSELQFTEEGVLRFRDPYYLTFNLFSGLNGTSSPQPYTNDFQYIYLQKSENPENLAFDPIKIPSFSFGLFPDFQDSDSIDNTVSFWSDYQEGEAVVKMYESGNFTLNLITTEYKSTIPWSQEFIYPQTDGNKYYSSITTLNIQNSTNQTIEVYADEIEISKFSFFMNLLQKGGILLLWIISIFIIGALCQNAKVAGAFAGITFFVMIKLMGLI